MRPWHPPVEVGRRDGRSDGEIAGVLVIAEQTVKAHVSRILQEFGLRDRVQVVVFGYENGLVVPGR